MALYKFSRFIGRSDDLAFDRLYDPGMVAANSGIYTCEGCGREISHNVGDVLPPQNHHQHSAAQGPIRWRMTVSAQANGKSF